MIYGAYARPSYLLAIRSAWGSSREASARQIYTKGGLVAQCGAMLFHGPARLFGTCDWRSETASRPHSEI